jgi:hypothetical protein
MVKASKSTLFLKPVRCSFGLPLSLGSSGGGYDAISKYPDFKDGVGQLVEDAHHYGSAVYNEVLKLTGGKKAIA